MKSLNDKETVKNRRKWYINTIFLLVLTGATLLALLRGRDLGALLKVLGDADIRWLIPGVGLMVLFILGESLIIRHLLGGMRSPLPFYRCAQCSFVGFFFSCITPFAGGGQPAQVLFLRKKGVSSAMAVPMLVLITISYKLVLVVYGAVVFLLRPEPVWTALEPVRTWCIWGFFITTFVAGFFLLVILFPDTMEGLLSKPLTFAQRKILRLREKDLEGRLHRWMGQYCSAAGYLKDLRCLGRVLLMTIVQRTLLFLVSYLALRAFGIKILSPLDAALLQGMISLGTDLLPLPGGTGANETMFLSIYTPLLGETALPVLLVCRGISYYAQLLITAVFTAGALTGGKKNNRGKTNR